MPSRATLIADALRPKKAPDAPDVFSAPKQSWADYVGAPPATGYEGMPAPQAEGMPEHDPGLLKKLAGALGNPSDVQTPASALMSPEFWQAMGSSPSVQGVRDAVTAPVDAYQGKFDPTSDEGIGRAVGMAGMAMTGGVAGTGAGGVALGSGPIRAYHGSPHDFDKFDLSKIGTGEGAQAYGHGLYFAEKEGVAKSYRDAMGPGAAFDAIDRFLLQRRGFNFSPEEMVQRLKSDTRLAPLADDPKAVNALRDLLPTYTPNAPVTGKALDHYRYLNDAVEKAVPGRMYEVAIHADPERFLDWDKVQHSGPAAESLSRIGLDPKEFQTGSGVYNRVATDTGLPHNMGFGPTPTTKAEVRASELLREAGIPGIKYLDQGSRATSGGEILGVEKGANGFQAKVRVQGRTGVGFQGPADMVTTSKPFPTEAEALAWAKDKTSSGSHNYVLFDDKIVEILRKYGVGSIAALPPAVQMAIQLHQDQAQAEPQEPTFAGKASGMINTLQRKLRGPEPPATPLGMGIRG